MKKTLIRAGQIAIFVVLFLGILHSGQPDTGRGQISREKSASDFDAGCTVIYGVDDDHALGGNNEDYSDPNTRIWFFPPEEGKFGLALVGYDGFIWQGGVNDQGLFFDGMAVDEPVQVEQGNKPAYPGSLPLKALEVCSDVDCVLDLFDEYHAYDTWAFQFLFGDAIGNSVIIEPRQTNRGGSFNVGTNFYQSTTNENECRYCDRYWTARSMFERADVIDVELMRDILNSTHLDGDYPTLYSTIYDLKENLIYLYLFHNFEEVKVFDLDEELSKGYHVLEMEKLFQDDLDYSIFARTERSRQADIRSMYIPVELDPSVYAAYLGDYQGPEDLDMAYEYYSLAYENGDLILKMKPDKAWLKLEPTSETEYFHLSYFEHFEINFQPDVNGVVDGFVFSNADGDYEFERISIQAPAGEEESQPETLFSSLWNRIDKFSGTNTFIFLAIIFGLVFMQFLLQYLRSLLA